MKRISILLILIALFSSCSTDLSRNLVYYPNLKDIRIISIEGYNSHYERFYYWDLTDSTEKHAYVDEYFKDSLIIGKIY